MGSAAPPGPATMPRLLRAAAATLLAPLPSAAPAAVVARSPGGFVIRDEVLYAGDPAAVWQRLVLRGTGGAPSTPTRATPATRR